MVFWVMENSEHFDIRNQEPPPEGFTVEPLGRDDFIIHHKRTGMGCMKVFIGGFLAFWTFFCVMMLRNFTNRCPTKQSDSADLLIAAGFWIAEIVVACLAMYLFFAKKTFRVDYNRLVMQTDVVGFKWSRTIDKHAIKQIVQIKDGGEDEDSFPSWGLKAVAEKDVKLIFRQPYEKSLWLGRVLAQWAGVEFVKVEKE
jgi:hypothetical protein